MNLDEAITPDLAPIRRKKSPPRDTSDQSGRFKSKIDEVLLTKTFDLISSKRSMFEKT
jgi:hypothetical protein